MLHVDVKFAFLDGDLQEKFNIARLEGFVQEAENGKIMTLQKAIYSLEQVGRAWNQVIGKIVLSMGFIKSD